MKKYVVLRMYKNIQPSAVFTTNDWANACSYASIMSNEDDYEYAVAEVRVSYVKE